MNKGIIIKATTVTSYENDSLKFFSFGLNRTAHLKAIKRTANRLLMMNSWRMLGRLLFIHHPCESHKNIKAWVEKSYMR